MPDGDESGGGRGWVKVLIAALTLGFFGPSLASRFVNT